ncbi:ABC transporter permease [Christensenella timonensis]|uniref:ABC transporter permease n=1 Tax=Christensenella timonensis TaxID=1816678 RepID=UPI000831DE9A|nr:ABC transporter permease [Christensenella timonensis]
MNTAENNSLKRKKIKLSSLTIYIGLLALIVVFAVVCQMNGKNFLTWNNISNILVQSSIIAIVAIGASLVILTGGIDLSTGAVVGLIGMASALMIKNGMSIPMACILGLLCGCGFGLISGLGISYGKVPPFIMTLGMQGIASGMTLAISGGKPVSGFPMELSDIANTTIAGIPIFIVYVAILYVVMVFVMSKTRAGRYIYAIGGNRNAARLSGVNTNGMEAFTYIIAGLFSAIGGILLLSRLSYASTTAGNGYELDAIAAAVIGGISLSGGQGKLINTLFGALIMGVLKAGLQILDVSTYFQQIAIGAIIIICVFLDKSKERKAE